jgi:hypothetical protein
LTGFPGYCWYYRILVTTFRKTNFRRDYHFFPEEREWRWLVEYNHQFPLAGEYDGGGWLIITIKSPIAGEHDGGGWLNITIPSPLVGDFVGMEVVG